MMERHEESSEFAKQMPYKVLVFSLGTLALMVATTTLQAWKMRRLFREKKDL